MRGGEWQFLLSRWETARPCRSRRNWRKSAGGRGRWSARDGSRRCDWGSLCWLRRDTGSN